MDIAEYKKYKANPIEFIEKFFDVANYKRGKYTNTILHDWQKTIVSCNKNLVIKKLRNCGVTTSFTMMVAYLMNYTNLHILYVSPKSIISFNFKKDVIEYMKKIPSSVKSNVITNDNKFSFSYGKSSFQCCSEDSVEITTRGQSYDLIIWDEMSDSPKIDYIFNYVYSSLSPRCNNFYMMISSTPTSNNSFFNQLWYYRNFNTLEINMTTVCDNGLHPLNQLSKESYLDIINEYVI